MAVQSKKDDMLIVGGGGKGKKGKKNKQQKVEQAQTFNIDFAVINMFGIVGVSPPIAPTDLDPKIEELTTK